MTAQNSGGNRNRSLRRKQAARLAATRALYARQFEDVLPPEVEEWADMIIAAEREAAARDDAETALAEAPERAMLVLLLESAHQHEHAIAALIDRSMGDKWGAERMGPLLESILRIAVAELIAKKDRDAGIIISEYVNLTEAYFDDGEVGFVNGILAAIAKELRE